MNSTKAMTAILLICIILLCSTVACIEEGGLLDTQPYPPLARTERAATLTR